MYNADQQGVCVTVLVNIMNVHVVFFA